MDQASPITTAYPSTRSPEAPTGPPRTDPTRVTRWQAVIFAVVCAGFILSNLDTLIVNVAFPAIEHEFRGSSQATLSWTLTAYSIVFAALLVPAGRLSDRSSHKNGFLLGLVLFTAGSALCAAAQGAATLIAARVLQAAGAATLVPTALALLLAAYPPERRASAVRALTGVGGVGMALAPVIGGLLVNLGWRWIFLINVPIGVACFVVGRRVLPDARVDDRGPLPDLAGSLLLIGGVAAIALGLVKAPEWGWTSTRFIECTVAGVAVLVAFAVRSARHANPVISIDLMRIRSFGVANAVSLLFAICFSATLLSMMLWCENVWHYSALRTAFAVAPGGFLMPLVAASSGKLVKRTGAAFAIALGCVLLAGTGIWWAVMAQPEPDYVRALLPGAIMFPVGGILTLTTLVSVVTKDLPATALATGSAINTTVRQLGFVIGVSMFVAALGTSHTVAQIQTGYQRGWVIAATSGFAAIVLTFGLLASRLARQPAHAARVSGHRRVWAPAAVAGGMGLVVVLAAGMLRTEADTSGAVCVSGAARPLSVAAAPEIAGVVADLVRAAQVCAVVRPIDPGAVSDTLVAGRGDGPDVWIPDSSVWTSRRSPVGPGVPQDNPSVALSPVVVAVRADTAARLGRPSRSPGFVDLLPRAGATDGPVRFSLSDPERSAATAGVLLGLRSGIRGRPDGPAVVTAVLRGAARSHVRPEEALSARRPGTPLGVPATEQQVFVGNAEHPGARIVATYLPGRGYADDYPYVLLSSDHAQRIRAQQVLDQLRGDSGHHRLLAAGFRDASGRAGPALVPAAGVEPGGHPAGPVPDRGDVDRAARALTAIQLGSRLLTVFDISGPMATPVPGAGGASRMALVLAAAMNGLAVYPDSTEAGLWTFSRKLSRDKDYRELVPVVRLGTNPDGNTGRMRLGQALAGIRPIRGGGTGLYSTALAAVRSLRRDWNPDAVNSVVLLTGGHDDSPGGITLPQLVEALRSESDPAHPVYLTTIAVGPDADTAALAAMSRATGGEMYRAKDPRDIRQVVLDAIGRRVCRPHC
jgi:EmrB/QacA subfamily drug resistance transporter